MSKQIKKNIKLEWDLGLLYKSHTDPQIEKDVLEVEGILNEFEKKYKNKDFTKNSESLLKALKDFESIIPKTYGLKAVSYYSFAKDINAEDKKAEAEITKLSNRLTSAFNKVIFFDLEISKIPEVRQKEILNSPKFKHYRYHLEGIFKRAKHNLTEPEEKIMSLKSLTSRQLWVSGFDKLLSKQTVLWKGKEIPIDEAMSMVHSLPTQERRQLHDLNLEKIKSVSDFAESEINAVYTDKKINDELRKFKNPYDATLLSHETDKKMVFALQKAVTNGFKISHRFYKLKARLLKLPKLTYADRGAPLGKTKKELSFEDGLDIVRKSFSELDENFTDILNSYLKNGQIDVYPKKGKTGGAYCSSGVNSPTFVLLNHTPQMRSVMTIAHEMGHGIHFEYGKSQPHLYQGCSIAVAEVASTFFEQVVFNNFFKTLSPADQIVALHNRISENISTIFRQIACFNFELDLHKAVREGGFVSKEEISKLMNKHMKSYLGPIVEMKDLDGYFFSVWSHIRNFFYVYSYSYGCLISKALYRKYKDDNSYFGKIKSFMSAGSSKSPYDIFMDIGIDTADPKFWEEGLKVIEEEIKLLEKLTKK